MSDTVDQITGLLGEADGMNSCSDPVFRLDSLRERFDECIELRPDRLWALVRGDEGGWVDVSFVTFHSSNEDGSGVEVEHFFSSSGPSGNLRECRHSYFGEQADGYVFYLNFENTRLALDFLGRYFDGD